MTKQAVFKGSAAIGNSGIKKHFKNAAPWQCLFELIWNGFDAAATFVSVEVVENEMHGLERITVLDDGDGIDFDTLNDTFGSFNDSAKRANLSLKGEHGRGRLAFHLLCRNASWFTRCNGVDAAIYVAEPTIKDFEGRLLERPDQKADLSPLDKGTLVELTQFTGALPELDTLREKLSAEFGWYLAVHPEKQIVMNGQSMKRTHKKLRPTMLFSRLRLFSGSNDLPRRSRTFTCSILVARRSIRY